MAASFSSNMGNSRQKKRWNSNIFLDGIIEDVSAQLLTGKNRDRQFSEMQTALLFLNQQIETLPLENIIWSHQKHP